MADLKIFTCNNFTGHWPVGVGAVHARELLLEALVNEGLGDQRRNMRELEINELNSLSPCVRILCNGEY